MLESELDEIEDAAKRAEETKSEWVRRVLLAAARAGHHQTSDPAVKG